MNQRERRAHQTHCCVLCGCKYRQRDCPVTNLELEQAGPCDLCQEEPAEAAELILTAVTTDGAVLSRLPLPTSRYQFQLRCGAEVYAVQRVNNRFWCMEPRGMLRLARHLMRAGLYAKENDPDDEDDIWEDDEDGEEKV